MKRDELLLYYERELRFIRKLASEFADKYPQVASRLQLEPTKCEDPHVERLIEAFSMLTARVHMRLDDDFSEITDALLGILYPHYLRPIPSMSIAQMSVDPDLGAAEGGLEIKAGSILRSRPVGGVRCTFRTAYPVTLFPVDVASVDIIGSSSFRHLVPEPVGSALCIRMKTLGDLPFSSLAIERLRFFLDASSGDVESLYELFLRDPRGLLVRGVGDDSETALLPANAVQPVGFGRSEGLLEYPSESFVGYRLLQEYFTFPEKFLFVELTHLADAVRRHAGNEIEILLLLESTPAQLRVRVEPENLKLGCTPIVNLFARTADPIRLTHATVEYPVCPDARSPGTYEVHSISQVTCVTPSTGKLVHYQPFYGRTHSAEANGSGGYWHAVRRPTLRKGEAASTLHLSLVDPNFDPLSPPVDVLHVQTLCSNGGLPARLPFGNANGDFQLEGRPDVARVVALRKPTESIGAPVTGSNRWRLISHLTLNYLSLMDDPTTSGAVPERRAVAALREVLRLYDFSDSPVSRQRIDGLMGLRTRRIVRRVGRGVSAGFARGLEAELEFDASQYTGTGVFLFASVLERFLGLYTSVNSFTQTVAKVRHHPGILKRWAPRSGERTLL